MTLTEILFGKWVPPKSIGTIKHSAFGTDKKKPEPVHARAKIMRVLDDLNWMSNRDIADKTDLQINTVQTTTSKLYEKKRLERKIRKDPGDQKPIYMYRRK